MIWKPRLPIRRILYVATAVAVSGCAQAPSAPAMQTLQPAQTAARPDVHFYGNDWMYASQPSDNEVVAYKRDSKTGKLKYSKTVSAGLASPSGMMATPGGWLYVANAGDSDILVYRSKHKGPIGPLSTLNDPGQVPTDVAASADRNLVAVANESTTTGGAGSVSVYLNHGTTPAHILTYGNDPVQGEGVAIDSSGNCYWSFNDPYMLTGSVVEFYGCSGTGVPYASAILKVGGIALDASGNLYFVDQILGIWKCTKPNLCGIFLQAGLFGLLLPRNINFDNSQPQNMWVSDAAGYIDAVNLQGLLFYTLEALGGSLNPPFGIAPSPSG